MAPAQGGHVKPKGAVQMNSKLRQQSNNNSVNLRKPLNANVESSMEGLSVPNIMNHSSDQINHLLVHPQIAKMVNEISRSSRALDTDPPAAPAQEYNNE